MSQLVEVDIMNRNGSRKTWIPVLALTPSNETGTKIQEKYKLLLQFLLKSHFKINYKFNINYLYGRHKRVKLFNIVIWESATSSDLWKHASYVFRIYLFSFCFDFQRFADVKSLIYLTLKDYLTYLCILMYAY